MQNELRAMCRDAEFEMRCCVDRYHEATSDHERAMQLIALDHARAVWLHCNAGLGRHDQLHPSLVYHYDPDKLVTGFKPLDDGDDDDAF